MNAKVVQANSVGLHFYIDTAKRNVLIICAIIKNLAILPALLQTAVLSLLSAALPLTATLTSTSLAIVSDGQSKKTVLNPSPREIEVSQSFHVFAFTSHDELILVESEGSFTTKEWDDVFADAQRQCCSSSIAADGDTLMGDSSPAGTDLKHFTRSTLEEKIISDLHWK